MNLDILYIRDLKNLLPYKDTRSICDFCRQNNVEILGTKKRRYVLAVQFKRALLQERIRDLKAVYGERFTEALKSEMALYARLQSILDESKKETSTKRKNQTILKGENENRFLLDIYKEIELPLSKQK